MRFRFAVAAAAFALTTVSFAQGNPRETVSAGIGAKKVSIEYGRPSLKGRKLEDLIAQLPVDRIWRAGVDEVTTLTTEADLAVAGKRVPAGKYSLYLFAPAEGDWALVLNSDPGIPLIKLWAQAPANEANLPYPRLDGYSNVADKEVLRAPMKPAPVAPPVESFKIALAPSKTGATLTLAWGDRSWSLELAPAK